jgi:hypothetical protein
MAKDLQRIGGREQRHAGTTPGPERTTMQNHEPTMPSGNGEQNREPWIIRAPMPVS